MFFVFFLLFHCSQLNTGSYRWKLSTFYLLQSISMAIQQGNTVCVMGWPKSTSSVVYGRLHLFFKLIFLKNKRNEKRPFLVNSKIFFCARIKNCNKVQSFSARFGWFWDDNLPLDLLLSGASHQTLVFCYQNCSDLLWEKMFYWNSRL